MDNPMGGSGGLMGGLPPMRQIPQMPSLGQAQAGGLSNVNPSLMQFLEALMSQPGGNPWGAPGMGQLPQLGTPWPGGVPLGLPQSQMPAPAQPPVGGGGGGGGDILGGGAVAPPWASGKRPRDRGK